MSGDVRATGRARGRPLLRPACATRHARAPRAGRPAAGRAAGRRREDGAALRVAPGSGVWWVGLGISQEAQQRAAEAADSFRRAKDTGNLSTELAGFVERKLKVQR